MYYNMFDDGKIDTAALRIIEQAVYGSTPEQYYNVKNEHVLGVHSQLTNMALERLVDMNVAKRQQVKHPSFYTANGNAYKVKDKRFAHESHAKVVFDDLKTVEMSAWFVLGEIHGHSTCFSCRTEDHLLEVADESFNNHKVGEAIHKLKNSTDERDKPIIVDGQEGNLRTPYFHPRKHYDENGNVSSVSSNYDNSKPSKYDRIQSVFGYLS